MKMKLKLLTIFILFCFTSCDYYYGREYVVYNFSDFNIEVDLFVNEVPIVDTIYTIETNEFLTIHRTPLGNGRSAGDFTDVDNDLTEITIRVNDSLISSKNYLENSSWDFFDSTFTAEITNAEFE